MISIHSDFLQTITESPDDDAPRLVFADWLEETGEADRAEFIRVQCELARLNRHDPRLARLQIREQELLRAHEVEWRSELPQLNEVSWGAFERGFVSVARIESAEALTEQAAMIFGAAPVCEARFHRITTNGAKRIAVTPQLARLRVLDLEDGNLIGNAGAEALANSPYIGGLTTLKLRGNAIGPAGARALSRAAKLGALTYLNLDHNAVYDEGVQAIVESPRMRWLAHLSLGWTQCGEPAAVSLARSAYMSNLRWLYLSGNQIGDEGTAALAASKHLNQLEQLFLEGNRITDSGAIALARSQALGNVEWLYLKGNRIGNGGAIALAGSSALQKMRELVLVENPIEAEGRQLLRERFGNHVWLW